jgi:hypothetical protein
MLVSRRDGRDNAEVSGQQAKRPHKYCKNFNILGPVGFDCAQSCYASRVKSPAPLEAEAGPEQEVKPRAGWAAKHLLELRKPVRSRMPE